MQRPETKETSPEVAAVPGAEHDGKPNAARRDGWIATLGAFALDGSPAQAAAPVAGNDGDDGEQGEATAAARGLGLTASGPAPPVAAIADKAVPDTLSAPGPRADAAAPAAGPTLGADAQGEATAEAGDGARPAAAPADATVPDRPSSDPSAAPAPSVAAVAAVALSAGGVASAASGLAPAVPAAPADDRADQERESDAAPPDGSVVNGAGLLVTGLSVGGAQAVIVGGDPLDNGALASAALTNSVANDSSALALAVEQAQTLYETATGGTLDGAGLKIGIMSDSFDLKGGEAAAIADGDLPPASQIDIVQEGASGGDEGQAMAEMVYQIAPAAQIYFYTATSGESAFAQGIATLVADGCNVIVDDVIYTDEPFFQDTGVISQAVENAVSAGVDYFTAAGNSDNNFYEAAFDPLTNFTLPGVSGALMVHDVGNNSPYEAVDLTASNPFLDFTVQWTQPFGSNAYDLGVGFYSYDSTTDTYTLLASVANSAPSDDPELAVSGTLENVTAGVYYLAFYESDSQTVDGAPITPGTFKLIFFQGSQAILPGYGAGAGIGSGTSVGHELVPDANTVGAVSIVDTPPRGGLPPDVESYSAYGPGATYINAAGQTLATPIDDGKPDFVATDGSPSTIFNPFYGTSAAAPNAAAVGLLLLQADSRLTPAQVTYLLERSAIPTASSLDGGAGLIQANTAVAGAITASSTPIWTAQQGTTLWSDALNWSDSAVPGAASPVQISDGLGLFTGSYLVAFDQAADTVAALTVDGGTSTGARPTLRVQAGDVLTTGSVTLGAGTLQIAGTLVDSGALLAGSAAGAITVDATGRLSIGGTAAGSDIVYSGTGGEVVFSTTDSATLVSGLTDKISNFDSGDVLGLSGLAVSSVAHVDVNGSTVTVLNASDQTLASLQVTGDFTELGYTQLGFAADGDGTAILACFCSGTRIASEHGDVPVERLRPGQRVRDMDGQLWPIRWLGRSRVAWQDLDPLEVLPVRVRAGALGQGLPVRDLLVSPCHALLLDGVLVQAGALVNGTGIVRETSVQGGLIYWHIELDTHALLLAEGAAAESFLAGVELFGFDNFHERIAPADPQELPYPRCKAARQLPRALAARLAAWRPGAARAAA